MKPKTIFFNSLMVVMLLLSSFGSAPSVAASPAVPEAVTLYVAPGGTGDCTSWANACELQTALGLAVSGDEVWVHKGLYKPTTGADREATFSLVSEVGVYGGFAGTETSLDQRDWLTNVTVLSGDIDNNDNTDPYGVVTDTVNIIGDNSYHVVTNQPLVIMAVLDGFTITAGSDDVYGGEGGGLLNAGGLTLVNLTFSANLSGGFGGGISSDGGLILENIRFINNHADWNGGGLANLWGIAFLTQVVFNGNTAGGGGGMFAGGYNNILDDVTFDSNTAVNSGGGFLAFEGGRPVLTNVTFINNQAGGCGGGMYAEENGAPSLENVIFEANQSGESGGGLCSISEFYPTSLVNVIFLNNEAAESGGGMYSIQYSEGITLDRVEFLGNQADADDNGSGDGGGLFAYAPTLSLTETTFISNTAVSGGGIYGDDFYPNMVMNVVDAKFIGNQADDEGGGMFSGAASLTMVNSMLSGNQAGSLGGGMYHLASSPVITNTSFSANTASQGGGMYIETPIPPATLNLPNSILWGNRAGEDNSHQIYPPGAIVQDPHCMVENHAGEGYHGCNVIEDANVVSPFVDPDGADDIPGTEDDDLHLIGRSKAIDSGDNDLLPPSVTNDLDGNPRFYADEDRDGQPDAGAQVDLGAFEVIGSSWYVHFGDVKLMEGQAYREGFHAEFVGTSEVTIAETLTEYAAGEAEAAFNAAREIYELAFDSAGNDLEARLALLGIQDATWELATGAMLLGNDKLVAALDVTASGEPGSEIEELQDAIEQFNQATGGYLELFTSERFPDFLATQGERIDPLTGDPRPYADLIRMAQAAAKKGRATLELAERQFRYGERTAAEQTTRLGFYEALVELAVLHNLWPDAVEEDSYLELLRTMGDLERIYEFLQGGKNPFGYGPDFVPFHYRPSVQNERGVNNYEQTMWIADNYLDTAEERIEQAEGYQQTIDDHYANMQTALFNAIGKYDSELQALCSDLSEADCGSGAINEQLIAIQGAMLRLDMVLQQMENQNELILIEQERTAQVAGIHRATAELIKADGEKLADLASQQVKLEKSRGVGGGFLGILGGIFSGTTSGAAGGPYGALAGGIIGGVMEAGNWANQDATASDLASVAAAKERLYASQQARVQYAEAQVVMADSEAKQRIYFLKFAELEIDYAIALNNLMQEVARLKSLQARGQYLIAEKEKARTYYSLLYREYLDPAARVLRNEMMETAHSFYESALNQAYRAGRALAYEINQDVHYTGDPLQTPDDLYPINDSFFLGSALGQMDHAYETWHADNPSPQERTDIVYLSRAMGFEDYYDSQLGRLVTREEQFNALVRGRADPQKLNLQFLTSIHLGNIFFPTLFYNDKIISIRARVLGEDLGIGGREPVFVDLRLTQAGTSFIRTSASEITCGGDDEFQEYNIKPQVAAIQAAIYQNPFPQVNKELATRSVAFTNWIMAIDTSLGGENQYLNLDNIDEIELQIDHEAYTLQCTYSSQEVSGRSASFEPQPTRPYQPMQQVLPAWNFSASADQGYRQVSNPQENGVDLNDTYVGSVYLDVPTFVPPIELLVALSGSDGSITGHISPTLSYPMVPISGTWSGHSFYLESDPFVIILSSGLTYTRQVFLETGVISDSLVNGDSGITLSGDYRETLTGLTPEVLVITGTFRLDRPAHILLAAFTASPVAGPPRSVIWFEDLSVGNPTSWEWDFGDGVTSTEQHPSHTYTQVGSYTVSLTVHKDFGTSSRVEEHFILIYNPKIFLPIVYR